MIAAAIILAALTTRELGGGQLAQALSSWGFAFCALPLVTGHLLVTATVDFALWAAVLLCVTRALLRDAPRWWLAAGAVAGVSMYNKLLIGILLLSLLAGLLLVGPRQVLRSRLLWASVAIALIVGAPNLIYQATHGFPQIEMAAALNGNNSDEVRAQLLPFQALLVGPTLLPVWIAGMVALLRRPEWRPARALAVAYVVALVLTFVGGAQVYYAFGLQAFLLAAGFVPTVDWMERRRWRQRRLRRSDGMRIVSSSSRCRCRHVGRPLARGGAEPDDRGPVGWPGVSGGWEVASLTPKRKARAVILTGNYGEAGAVDRFGGAYHLPPVYSGQNELWYLGPPPAERAVVIAWAGPGLFRRIGSCEVKATMDNGYGVENEEQGTQVAVCQLPAGGWAELWPRLQHYD
jgi:hypothetical protein